MGSSRAGWRAGWKPKKRPAAAVVPSPLATDIPGIRNSQPVKRQIAHVATRPSRIPSRPPASVWPERGRGGYRPMSKSRDFCFAPAAFSSSHLRGPPGKA